MLDLDTLDTTTAAETGATLELAHPSTGAVIVGEDGKAVTITLAGQDSKRFRDADRKITDKRLATTAAGRRPTLTSASLEGDSLARLVACTMSWSGVTWGGSEKECTPENARLFYTRFPAFREQAEAFISERANFLKAPPSN